MNPGTHSSYEATARAGLFVEAAPRAGFADYLELTKPRLSFLSVLTAMVGYLAVRPGLSGVEGPALSAVDGPARNGWTLLYVSLGTAMAAGGVAALNQWLADTHDLGAVPETELIRRGIIGSGAGSGVSPRDRVTTKP